MRRRLILGAVCVLMVVIVVLSVPFGVTIRHRLTTEFGERVEREAFAIAAAVEDRLEQVDRAALQGLVELFASRFGGRILLTDGSGALLADSLRVPSNPPPTYGAWTEIARALRGAATWAVRSSPSLGYDLLVSTVPVVSTGRVLGAVHLSVPMRDLQVGVRRTWVFLGVVGAVGLAAAAGLAAWLVVWTVTPLTAAAAVARTIAEGDLEARVPERGPPEVRELARDMNLMAERMAERLRSDREFAANASHQLRTPLAALRLSLEEALDGPQPEAEIRSALEQVDRLSGLVDSLLALGQARERGAEAVDLVALSRGVVAADPADGPVIVVTGAGAALATTGRAREVVTNLLSNARRFARTTVILHVERAGERVVLAIDDDGPGFEPEDRDRVFDRFYRGPSPRGSGSGLGLAVARELAQADGGSVSAMSSELGGARFEVAYLPADSRAPLDEEPPH